jgi:hypothetical protein
MLEYGYFVLKRSRAIVARPRVALAKASGFVVVDSERLAPYGRSRNGFKLSFLGALSHSARLSPLQTATEEQEQRQGYEEEGQLPGNGDDDDGSEAKKVKRSSKYRKKRTCVGVEPGANRVDRRAQLVGGGPDSLAAKRHFCCGQGGHSVTSSCLGSNPA